MTSLELFRLDGQTAVVVGGAGPSALRGALYLASAAASMVTGHILAVDGGTLAS